MPCRDFRPLFYPDRMMICEKHLSKVFLVTRCAGKVVPEVTGSARGVADEGSTSRDGGGLIKNISSPCLNVVAGLLHWSSLLRQLQLKEFRWVKENSSTPHMQSDCSQFGKENTCQDPVSGHFGEMGKWSLPLYLLNMGSEQRSLCKLNVRESSLSFCQQSSSKLDMHRTEDMSASSHTYLLPSIDPRKTTDFTTSWSYPPHLEPCLQTCQRTVSATSHKSLLKLLPDAFLLLKSVSTSVDPQPCSVSSQLTMKTSRPGNIFRAFSARLCQTPRASSKAFHTFSVTKLGDGQPLTGCSNFQKEKGGEHPPIHSPALLRPRHSLDEHEPQQADASAKRKSTSWQNITELSFQDETVGANEKCAKLDTKEVDKSLDNTSRSGSMEFCTQNPDRDCTTSEIPSDRGEMKAMRKLETTGIHWTKSSSRKVVNHVCQILKQNKWGKETVKLLDDVNGNLSRRCVNAILLQQKDAQVCLAFFNWARHEKGHKHDVFSFTTMINILGRARDLRGVTHLLEDMHTDGIRPTVVTYNTLILCFGKVQSVNESLQVFQSMQEGGCKPDKITYSILIHLCVKSGRLQEALKLYHAMLEAGVQPDTITYSIVIDSLGKSDNLKEARKLFHEMKERGFVPNEFTYNSMINRHAKARKTQHAMRYFNEMRGAGFKLNAVTCTTMMSVLASLGKFKDVEGLFLEMEQAGVVADAAAYSLMINMWGNSGNLDKAVRWYDKMLGSLVTPSLSVFSSLVNAHLEANLYETTQHFLESMGMWGINADLKLYTILLRHCTLCEKQEHTDAVMGIMDQLGHQAHHFVYELLTAENQAGHATRSRVESYFDSVQHEVQDHKQAFANALIDFLYKLRSKTDPGFVWEIAMEKGLYPSAIIRRKEPTHWLVDLHSMSVGTALVALPRLLAMLHKNWVQLPTKRVYIVTGWGKRSKVTGSSAMKQAVNEVLDCTRSPFSLDHSNAGVFVSYGPPFRDWISEPSTMRELGVMVAEGVVQ